MVKKDFPWPTKMAEEKEHDATKENGSFILEYIHHDEIHVLDMLMREKISLGES